MWGEVADGSRNARRVTHPRGVANDTLARHRERAQGGARRTAWLVERTPSHFRRGLDLTQPEQRAQQDQSAVDLDEEGLHAIGGLGRRPDDLEASGHDERTEDDQDEAC